MGQRIVQERGEAASRVLRSHVVQSASARGHRAHASGHRVRRARAVAVDAADLMVEALAALPVAGDVEAIVDGREGTDVRREGRGGVHAFGVRATREHVGHARVRVHLPRGGEEGLEVARVCARGGEGQRRRGARPRRSEFTVARSAAEPRHQFTAGLSAGLAHRRGDRDDEKES